jgi:hypothetical protein
MCFPKVKAPKADHMAAMNKAQVLDAVEAIADEAKAEIVGGADPSRTLAIMVIQGLKLLISEARKDDDF